MSVASTKGERLGKVIRCDAETFVVEKGAFFPKDYELRYDHISALDGNDISYLLSDAETRLSKGATGATLGTAASSAAAAATTTTRATTATTTAAAATAKTGAVGRGEVHIPLMEEEVDIDRVARETGRVRIHKTVRTEEKHFTVPVTREDVVIERLQATSTEPALTPEYAFKEQTVDVPLHEEDVRVTKHPRLREEMVVKTVVQAVEKDASASLRHEECEVEDSRGPTYARSTDGSGRTTTSPGGYSAPRASER
jgi:uncharacterized protein (TIGR02271 family)